MTEPSPLSFFGPGLDPGPSFVELARQVRPSILPGAALVGFEGGDAVRRLTSRTAPPSSRSATPAAS